MRTFRLERTTDPAGVSGTGVVAEGARFMTGKVCLSWFSTPTSVAVYDSVEDVEKIHGHGGSTRIVWDDGGLPAQSTEAPSLEPREIVVKGRSALLATKPAVS